jgi:hypothetical protein
LHEKPSERKAERGKNAGTNFGTRFPQASYFKKMCNVCQKYGGACTTWYLKYKRYKRDEELESRAAKKGAKKLVSSNVAKILENESSYKDRETCEKTMFTLSNPIKATNPIITA